MFPMRIRREYLVALAMLGAGASARAADSPPAPPAAAEPEQSIVVSGRKLSVRTLVDRKVYDVTGDIQASFGTISDVLGVIPSVEVDPDGVVSLRGDSNVLILIDGKPSALLSGSRAGDTLRSIPARDIESIEVLPTPPAQFKAEGVAGVINIIMRKKRPEGMAGNVQASLGDRGRMVVGADSSFHSGPLTASASAGFRRDSRERTLESEMKIPGTSTSDPLVESSLLSEHTHREIPTAGASVEYALDDRNTVSANLGWLRRGGPRSYVQDNAIVSTAGTTGSTQRLSSGHDPETEFDQRIGYTKRFDREGEELELSAHRSSSQQREHYEYANYSFVPVESPSRSNLDLNEDHRTTELGADYSLPLSDGHVLKLGYLFEQDRYEYGQAGANLDPAGGAETADLALTNEFDFRQQVQAAYASYQSKGDLWNVLAGLRAELADTTLNLLTRAQTVGGSDFEIYPSLHLTRALSESSTLSFGASRRIKRPDPDDLDPFIDYEYTPNLRAGNADLKPQITQSYEAGYGFEGARNTLQVTAYYRRNQNSVTEVTESLGNGISLTTKANLPKNDSAGLELTLNGHLAPTLGFNLSANPFYTQIDMVAFGEYGLKSTTGINAKLKLDYQPTSSDSVQLTFTRSANRLTPQGHVSATNLVNLGYRHRASSSFSVIATLSDALSGQRTERILETPNYSATYLRTVTGQVLYAGFIYSFGSARSKEQFDYDQP